MPTPTITGRFGITRMTREWPMPSASRAVSLPIIGIGGIMSATDALEFMLCGATAVQVGTASFITPDAAQRVAEGMEAWLRTHGESDVRNLIGALKT